MKVSIWDVLSVLFITATVIVIVVVGIIFLNPDSSINPFPVPTIPPTGLAFHSHPFQTASHLDSHAAKYCNAISMTVLQSCLLNKPNFRE
jgi:hypothetical protein